MHEPVRDEQKIPAEQYLHHNIHEFENPDVALDSLDAVRLSDDRKNVSLEQIDGDRSAGVRSRAFHVPERR